MNTDLQTASIAALIDTPRLRALHEASWTIEDLNAIEGTIANAPLPGSLLLIEAGIAGFQAVLEAYALRRADICVLLIADELPTEAVRLLFRFASSDVVAKSSDEAALKSAATTLIQRTQIPDTATQSATSWALRGAVGGAGTTTLAIEMAFATLRAAPTRRVCLIDLNLADGMSAAFLDGQKKLDIAALCTQPERIDETLLKAYTWKHDKGVFLMAPPRNPHADQAVSKDGMLRFLDVASNMFDHIVLDLPRHSSPWTDPILTVCDEAIVVSELTVPSLHAAADLCRDIDGVRVGTPTRLMLNRMFAKRSHRHSFPIDKAEQAIHRRIDHTVRSDWDSARMAVNLGMPVAHVKQKSPLVKDINEVIESLLVETPTARKVA